MRLRKMQRMAIQLADRWFGDIHDRGPENLSMHFALGMAGECGEAVEIIKKANRRGNAFEDCDRKKLAGELADLLTYVMDEAELHGIDLESAWIDKMLVNEERFQGGDWGYHGPRSAPAPDPLGDYRVA